MTQVLICSCQTVTVQPHSGGHTYPICPNCGSQMTRIDLNELVLHRNYGGMTDQDWSDIKAHSNSGRPVLIVW